MSERTRQNQRSARHRRNNEPRWRTLTRYLRDTFGERVAKLMLDAGFTCPNIDGTKSFGGCTFCDADGSGPGARTGVLPLREQIEHEIVRARSNRFGARKYLAYLQPHTNTYAPISRLREAYTEAIQHPDIVGLAIGARADCVPDAVLDLIAEFAAQTHVWLELGLQSASDESLRRTNRAETVGDFIDAVERAHDRNLRVCGHVLFGLPWETPDMMMETIDLVAALHLEGIKLHSLFLVPGTPMHRDVEREDLRVLSQTEYATLAADALERLPAATVIHRLTGEPPPSIPAIPEWTRDKNGTLDAIRKIMHERNTVQGSAYDPERSQAVLNRVRRASSLSDPILPAD